MYELIIIGGGPAGCGASVYAGRKQLKTLLITKEWGGQSSVSEDIQNWIGTPHISGIDLAKSLHLHVEEYKGENLKITEENVVSISKKEENFEVTTDKNVYISKTVLISTGSSRRKLEIPGASTLEHKGLTYCASCDGPLFSGTDVVVVGGGNAGFDSASQLLAYCKSVTLLSRSKAKADEITVEKIKKNNHFKLIENVIPTKVEGSPFLQSISYKNNLGEEFTLYASAVFVEIGQIPTTSFVEELLDLNTTKNIIVNPRTQETSLKGIWAAGDCTDVLYHQNNIAVGDAVKAIEDIYLHLKA